VKYFGLFLVVFAVISILYEKVWKPEKFSGETRTAIKVRRAITDWGLIVVGIVLVVFAPWSCE
jgi:hypothetical protein